MTEWRAIPGWEGEYEVSDDGQVRSLERQVPHRRHGHLLIKGRLLKTPPDGQGRPCVGLGRAGRHRIITVHSLVMLAFVGQRPEGYDICHGDGDKTNNVLSNLRYDTRSANLRDSVKHGTHPQSRKTHCPSGHSYDDPSVYVRRTEHGGVSRDCRICTNANRRRRRAAGAKH